MKTQKLPEWHEFTKSDHILLYHDKNTEFTDAVLYGLRDYNNTISICKETISAVKVKNSKEFIILTIEQIESLYNFAQKMKTKKLPKHLIVNM